MAAITPAMRRCLVTVLVYHQQTETSGCHCGWAKLGASWAEHVADVYDTALTLIGPGGS
jgi:hypothetical protein